MSSDNDFTQEFKLISNYKLYLSSNLGDADSKNTCKIYQNNNRFFVITRVAEIDHEMIEKYCACHHDFMNKYFSKNKDKPKFRFNFIYDCRDTTYKDVMKIVVPFVQCHTKYKEEYKSHLFATAIIINSISTQQMLNMFIGPSRVYNPTRPVIFVNANELESSLNEIYGSFVLK